MKILITGATGLIGQSLVRELLGKNHQVVVLSRSINRAKEKLPQQVEVFPWENPARDLVAPEAFQDVEAVVHLAGESIADGRWTDSKKKRLWSSRVDATENLIRSIKNSNPHSIKTFISSSAIGIYGDRGDELLTEESIKGEGFLPDLCDHWEKAPLSEELEGVRFVQLRTGIVLSKNGGALAKMLPPFKLGIGGRLGSGKQWMSWIHIEDMVRLIIFSLEKASLVGAVNATAPTPVDNSTFTKILATVLKRQAVFPVPELGLKILFGEMSSILLESQKVIPQKLASLGFKFKFDKLQSALESLMDKNAESSLSSAKVS